MRKCGECTLCCKLLPVRDLNKPACTVCQHQRYAKGCAIYDKRPDSCRTWSCAWLDDITNDTRFKRPDKAHYVIDLSPEYVTILNNETGEKTKVPTLQIWVDPKYPNAHRDKALRDLLIKYGVVGTVRFDSDNAISLIPPTMNVDRVWAEIKGDREAEHTPEQIVNFLKTKPE